MLHRELDCDVRVRWFCPGCQEWYWLPTDQLPSFYPGDDRIVACPECETRFWVQIIEYQAIDE